MKKAKELPPWESVSKSRKASKRCSLLCSVACVGGGSVGNCSSFHRLQDLTKPTTPEEWQQPSFKGSWSGFKLIIQSSRVWRWRRLKKDTGMYLNQVSVHKLSWTFFPWHYAPISEKEPCEAARHCIALPVSNEIIYLDRSSFPWVYE